MKSRDRYALAVIRPHPAMFEPGHFAGLNRGLERSGASGIFLISRAISSFPRGGKLRAFSMSWCSNLGNF